MQQTNIQQQKAQLKSIKHYWKQYGAQIRAWWSVQSKEDRLEFLLDWCPYMPLARDKPYTIVDGKREELYGAAAALPEWNQEDLVEGDRFIKLLAETTEVPDKGETASIPGYDAFTELCYSNISAAHGLVGKIKTQLKPEVYRSGIVLLMPGPRFGSTLVVKHMMPNIQDWLRKGIAVHARVFETLMYRQGILLTQVAMCLDHFRLEVLGKQCYKAIGPSQGCAVCGAVEPKNGNSKNLLACGACGVVFYCGKECQRAHWRIHKPECKPQPQQDKEKSNSKEGASSSAATAATPTEGGAGNSSSSDSKQQQGSSTTAAGTSVEAQVEAVPAVGSNSK